MKKSLITYLVSLLSLNFVSALGFGSLGYYGFGNLFYSFDIELFLNALLFITIFAVVHFSLEKSIFRENRAVSFVISLSVSAFAMYGLLSTGFSIQEILFSLGLNQDILPTLLWMVAITILLFLLIKFKIRNTIAILFGLLGAFLIVYSIVGDVYNNGAGIAIGILFLIIALFIHKKGPGKAYQYGKSIGKGIGKTGKFFNDHRPSKIFLKKEKRIIKKIKKLEKKYQKAMNDENMKDAKSYADQIEYLKIRLEGLQQKEAKVEKKEALQKQKAANSIYSSGMRRGGEKGTRGRFVSKASVDRYTQMYGEDAARKRFGR